MADLLPAYTWSRESSRYRNADSGRYVSRKDVLNVLDTHLAGAEQRLGDLTTAFHEGRVSSSVWMEQMSTELRRQHLQHSALGAGGWDQLTQRDHGRIGGKLQADYRRLEQFGRDIQAGDVTLAQALNRANLYAGNARVDFWQAEREHKAPAPSGEVEIERRFLTPADHCTDCINFYEQGWQPVGILPPPGVNSQCLTRCKCGFVSRTVPAAEVGEWIGTKR